MTNIKPLLDTSEAEENIILGIALNIKDEFQAAEIRLIRIALGQTKGNVSRASYLLGIRRTTLHEKIKRYSI